MPDKITEVLKQVAIGASINQISESLKLSVSGVRNRQRAAVTRLQAANITEAVYKAAKIGVI
ncbi:MAG: LuxR C-terminal-related transcriptional regulator [Paracoccaceae bacterium]